MSGIKRGEIYFIKRGGACTGSEQYPERPAIVVSNEKNNEASDIVEIVYMTLQPKKDLPTHTIVRSTGRPSTVLCEQVCTVSTERLGNYIGECTQKEMENIDVALMISLQLDGDAIKEREETQKKVIEMQRNELTNLREQLEKVQTENNDLKNAKYKETVTCKDFTGTYEMEVVGRNGTGVVTKAEYKPDSSRVIKIKTERDTYKAMYEQLIDRITQGGK